MIIDIISLVAIIVFAIWGARRGLIRQIALLASIVLMYFFASPVAEIFTSVIKDHSSLSIPERYIYIILLSLTATAIFVLINLLGAFLHKTLIKGITPLEKANKAFGFTLGALSCALVCYFILCLSSCSMGWIETYAPSLASEIKNSIGFSLTKQYNFIEDQMPEFAKKTGKPADINNSLTDNPPSDDNPQMKNEQNTPPDFSFKNVDLKNEDLILQTTQKLRNTDATAPDTPAPDTPDNSK